MSCYDTAVCWEAKTRRLACILSRIIYGEHKLSVSAVMKSDYAVYIVVYIHSKEEEFTVQRGGM